MMFKKLLLIVVMVSLVTGCGVTMDWPKMPTRAPIPEKKQLWDEHYEEVPYIASVREGEATVIRARKYDLVVSKIEPQMVKKRGGILGWFFGLFLGGSGILLMVLAWIFIPGFPAFVIGALAFARRKLKKSYKATVTAIERWKEKMKTEKHEDEWKALKAELAKAPDKSVKTREKIRNGG